KFLDPGNRRPSAASARLPRVSLLSRCRGGSGVMALPCPFSSRLSGTTPAVDLPRRHAGLRRVLWGHPNFAAITRLKCDDFSSNRHRIWSVMFFRKRHPGANPGGLFGTML